MKKLLLASLLLLPLAAQASFVEECKTASLNADPLVQINRAMGVGTDKSAKNAFSQKCSCLDAHLQSGSYSSAKNEAYVSGATIFYIRHNGRVRGIDPYVQNFIEDGINSCQVDDVQQAKEAFVQNNKSEINACVVRVAKSQGYTGSEGQLIKEVDYARKNGKVLNLSNQKFVSDGLRLCD